MCHLYDSKDNDVVVTIIITIEMTITITIEIIVTITIEIKITIMIYSLTIVLH